MADNKPEPAIEIKGIYKEFVLPQSKTTSLKQAAVNIVRDNKKTTQKVLNDINFTINKGDFFGIVGRNGSGKSTLLKLIAGVYTPTEGEIKIYGGLTPFIELGVGFNPEISGRDNVYLNGALLGFTRKQMDAMYEEIVEFAELGPFMDQKLKNYSSGMQVRLAFSIAIKAKNDILIFDEVLAVGDEAFQRKCLDVFESYKANGQTVILVTHDMDMVNKFCNKAILIHDGVVVETGDPKIVSGLYSQLNQQKIDQYNNANNQKTKQNHDVSAVLMVEGEVVNSVAVGQEVDIRIKWGDTQGIEAVWIDIYKLTGEHITNLVSSRDSKVIYTDDNTANVKVDMLIEPGSYYIDVGLWDINLSNKILEYNPAIRFTVSKDWTKTKKRFMGTTWLKSRWM